MSSINTRIDYSIFVTYGETTKLRPAPKHLLRWVCQYAVACTNQNIYTKALHEATEEGNLLFRIVIPEMKEANL